MTNESAVTQLHGLTPENLFGSIRDILKSELEKFKKESLFKEESKYLTRKEVAKMFSVNLSTINSWSKNGKLSPVGLGGRVYFIREEVEKAIIKLQN